MTSSTQTTLSHNPIDCLMVSAQTDQIIQTGVQEPQDHLLYRQQVLNETSLLEVLDAILVVDIVALDSIIQGETLHVLTRRDVLILWRLSWWSWQVAPVHKKNMLNVFTAVLRSLYPWLSFPDWVLESDPEHFES